MENKKKKAIEDAWFKVKGYTPDDVDFRGGWSTKWEYNIFSEEIVVDKRQQYSEEQTYQYEDRNNCNTLLVRPKELQGLEDNNGWIRLDEQFPKVDGAYIFLKPNLTTEEKYFICLRFNPNNWKEYTHWRPKERYKNPIY